MKPSKYKDWQKWMYLTAKDMGYAWHYGGKGSLVLSADSEL